VSSLTCKGNKEQYYKIQNYAMNKNKSKPPARNTQSKAGSGLQKLTDLRGRITFLLSKSVINTEDITDFSEADKAELRKAIQEKLNAWDVDDQLGITKFYEKVHNAFTDKERYELWEVNHTQILQAMSKYMKEYNAMPGATDIAKTTGLSRQTVYKHVKEYMTHPVYTDRKVKYKMLMDRVLIEVYHRAIEGDVKAARLYLEVTGVIDKQTEPPVIKNQTNYIQINGTTITQEILQSLSAGQIKRIEVAFKKVLPQSS
jgi:DNA-binding phage protein